MSGRRRSHLTGSSRRSTKENKELDLPTELLELILSRLSSRDRARTSVVCKRWQDIAKSLDKVNSAPVLMHFPKDYDGFDFCDLGHCNTTFRVSERPHGIVGHANNGWMLLFDQHTWEMTFWRPHWEPQTMELVKLPRLPFAFEGAVFSAPPTSPSCVVLTMYCCRLFNRVEIFSCRPGDTTWTTAMYQGEHPFIDCLWNCVVVRNGVFYCLDSTGHIGTYDPVRTIWRVLPIEPLKCMKYLNIDDKEKQLFMVEHNGDIFLARTWRVIRPIVYKLDEINNKWIKVRHLGGATLFASSMNSLIRDELPIPMKDCIYFPKIVYDEKQCVAYSLKHKKYYTESQSFDPGALECPEDIWIDFKGPL